jgi:hypothetical protein
MQLTSATPEPPSAVPVPPLLVPPSPPEEVLVVPPLLVPVPVPLLVPPVAPLLPEPPLTEPPPSSNELPVPAEASPDCWEARLLGEEAPHPTCTAMTPSPTTQGTTFGSAMRDPVIVHPPLTPI